MGFAMVVLLSCAHPLPSIAIPPHPPMALPLTASDQGKTIHLKVGSRVELCLPDNPSTGYRWTFKADPSVVDIQEGTYTQMSNLVGSGGEMQWFLTALKPGITTVVFKRWRVWEGEQSAIETFQLTFDISSP